MLIMKGIEELNAVYRTAYDESIIKIPMFYFTRRIFPQRSYCTRRVTTGASSKRLLMVASTNIIAYHFSSAKKRYRDWEW